MANRSLVARAAHALRGAFSTRSFDGGAGQSPPQRRIQPAYNLATQSGLVPRVPDIGPWDSVRYMRPCQNLVRHGYRNDNWIRSLVQKTGETVINTGPTPVSRYSELDDLFNAAASQFDARGVHDLGGLLRDDLHRDFLLDGEAALRIRSRRVRRLPDGTFVPERGLLIPLQFQSLSSAWLPTGNLPSVAAPERVVAGIQFDAIEHRVGYWPYSRHPRDTGLAQTVPLQQTFVPAEEFLHYFVPSQTGAPRPEVPLAAAYLRALKLAEYEDADLRRKITSQYLSVMLETDLPDQEDLPGEDEMRALIEDLVLSPGMIGRLPTGVKANLLAPPDSPNFQAYVRHNLLYICAGMGTPAHEVTGDYETITDRTAKYAGIAMKRRADIDRSRLEHQVLNPMRAAFVDACVATGLWTPPPGRPAWEAYRCEWQWPAVQLTQLTQELGVMMTAIEKDVIDRDTVTSTYFGMRPEVRDRRIAKSKARATVLGNGAGAAGWTNGTEVTARILVEATAEEAHERDLVEEAAREDAAVDPDLG